MKTLPTYLTCAETARELGVPVSRIHNAIASGAISPAGRAGSHRHAPVIFSRDDLHEIQTALRMGATAKASASREGLPASYSQNTEQVMEKFHALQRAIKETK
jgi:hypothetical protein